MMTSSGDPPLTPAFADKLTFKEGKVPGARDAVRAVHRESGADVIVADVEQKDIDRLRPWTKVSHAHLAKLVDIVEHEPGHYWVAVADTRGELLSARLKVLKKKHPVDAVRTALRVADALATLHDAGGAHGRLHPDTVLLSPESGREPIVLFGEPGPREYWPPDYPLGEPASVLTDTWATGALLFHMLTGSAPPSLGVANPDELTGLGITNVLLREAIAHALNRDKSARAENLQSLRRELARWFVEHVGEEPGPHSALSKPPPLPASMNPAGPRASVAPGRPSQAPVIRVRPLRRYVVMASTAVAFGLLAAWAVALLRKPKPIVVELQRPAPRSPGSASSAASAIDLAEVPVTGKEDKAGEDATATCISTFLPEGALSKQANLSEYCATGDLRQAMKLLRGSFATTGGAAASPKGWNDLGWFEIAALATLRAGCCSNATKITWPPTSADCPSMADALEALGRAVSGTQKADAEIKQFREAAHCEFTKGKPDLSRPNAEPSAAAERVYRELFRVTATP